MSLVPVFGNRPPVNVAWGIPRQEPAQFLGFARKIALGPASQPTKSAQTACAEGLLIYTESQLGLYPASLLNGRYMNLRAFSGALGLLLFTWQLAFCDFIVPSSANPVFGWNRGDANSFFYGWNNFQSYPTDTPDVSGSSGPGTASLTETTGQGFLTGGGNIYSFSAPTAFVVTLPTYNLGNGFETKVVAQFRTLGTELQYSNILLDGQAPTFTQELARTALGGFGGDQVDYLASWTLPSNTNSLNFTFNASGSSMSLDIVHVDGFASAVAVPEPSSMAIIGIGLASATYWRRRKLKKAQSTNS